jgi:hypothetical protein
MGSNLGNKRNVKIFVLYLMENINYPMDFITLNDVVMQTDYIMYLDFAESFGEMLDSELIECVDKDENGDALYMPTQKGRIVAAELKSDILPSILDQSLACALRYLNFKKRGITARCISEKAENGYFRVTFTIVEKDTVIFKTELLVDSELRAEKMKENFRERPETIYRGVNALLAGNVNYLFD